jgi:microcystin-dependent protein
VQEEAININYIGEIIIGVSNTPPPNTLLCDGSPVSISQYRGLYSLIGTTYGGSGNMFNLPNFSSYFPIGGNSTIGNVASSDISGGSQVVSANFGGASSSIPPLLTKMPLHSHIVNDFGHFHYRNTKSDDLFGISPGEGIISPFPFGINSSPNPEYTTGTSTTGITVSNLGDNILTSDTVSGLNGVNISLPYTSVFYYIFYN